MSNGDYVSFDYDRKGNTTLKKVYKNLALNKPVTAASFDISTDPWKANDGNPSNNSFWGTDLQGAPKWWQVDLGEVYEINKVVVRNYVDGVRYYTYKVEGSVDGTNWREVVNKTSNSVATDQGDNYSIPTLIARYLRVTMMSNSANTAVHISDFRAYGSPASIALNKPATAEESGSGVQPWKANDEDPTNNSFWGAGLQKWWQVDLGEVYEVNKLVVRNYVDGARVYTYKVEGSVDGTNWKEVVNKTSNSPATDQGDIYSIPTLVARYLRVTILSNSANPAVHMTDFRAYGIPASIALNKPATAEASGNGVQPWKANDEDPTNSSFWGAELQGTSKWWQVDLGELYEVNKLVVRNYVYGARYYTYKVEGSVDGTNWKEVVNKTSNSPATDQGDIYSIPTLIARYIRVTMMSNSDNTGVHVTDFRAYGTPASIALNKPATAEDSGSGVQPWKANDEDPTNNSFWGAGLQKWWQVDLGKLYEVNKLVVRNYVDGVRSYTYKVEGSVDGTNWKEVVNKTRNSPATDQGDIYSIPTLVAQYLRVTIMSNSANSAAHLTDFRAYE